MKAVRFRNQTSEEILKHLVHLLAYDTTYNLTVDPLRVYFEIKESTRPTRERSDKRKQIREFQKNLSTGKKKNMGTHKKTRPKIRSVKKFRTVKLKGIVY